MLDIKTDIDPSQFQPPARYAQVAPEKIRQQIDALTSAIMAVLRSMKANSDTSATPSPSPAASPKP